MNYNKILLLLFLISLTGCYDQDLHPVTEEEFPLQVMLDANEGGTYESDDSYGLKVTFDPGVDEVTDENGNVIAGSPEGTRGPAANDIIVNFAVVDIEGLNFGSDVTIDEVVYAIDDCTEGSADFTINDDGTGTFTIPAGIEEVEVVFSFDDAAIDNKMLNDEEKGFSLELTDLQGNAEDVTLNYNNVFEYSVLDDEDIFNEWALNIDNADLLDQFINAFSAVSEDLEGLTADDIDEILFEFGYEEVAIKVVLVETEMVEECGETEEENVEVELEGEFEAEDGEIEIVLENADEDEFTYAGTYEIGQDDLSLTMTIGGEDEDGEIVADETTLTLNDD